jgi:hypothetical protein
MILVPPKSSDATRKLTFDFISDLIVGETISSATTTATVWSGFDPSPSTVISGAATISGTVVTQLVTAGQAGTLYKLMCEATTSESQVLTKFAYLAIVDEPLAGVAPGDETPTGPTGTVAFMFTKAATLVAPQVGDSLTILYSPAAVNLTSIMALLSGGTAPSVTFKVKYGSSRASGTDVVTGGITVDSVTVGDATTTFDNGTIPANAFLWIEVTAVSGTPDELNVTFQF